MGRRSLKARSEHSLRVDILECHARYKGLLCLRRLGSGQKAAMTLHAASGNRHELLLGNFPKSFNEKKEIELGLVTHNVNAISILHRNFHCMRLENGIILLTTNTFLILVRQTGQCRGLVE